MKLIRCDRCGKVVDMNESVALRFTIDKHEFIETTRDYINNDLCKECSSEVQRSIASPHTRTEQTAMLMKTADIKNGEVIGDLSKQLLCPFDKRYKDFDHNDDDDIVIAGGHYCKEECADHISQSRENGMVTIKCKLAEVTKISNNAQDGVVEGITEGIFVKTKCPFGEDWNVGSIGCGECKHYIKGSYKTSNGKVFIKCRKAINGKD